MARKGDAERGGRRPQDPAERRLALAIEALGAGVHEHAVPLAGDAYHSGRWAEILGYTTDELPPAERFLDWLHARVHPDDVDRLRRAYDDFVEGRTGRYEVEARIRHKSGRWVWVRALSRAAARGGDGRITRVVGAMLDVTAQKEAERERAELLERRARAAAAEAERIRERYRSAFEGLDCIVFEAEPGGTRFRLVTGRIEDILGYPPERWYEPGFWLDQIVHPEDRARVREAFEGASAGGSRREEEFRAVAAEGREVWLQAVIRHGSADPGGGDAAPAPVRGIMVDITGYKRLQERERLLAAEVDHRAKNMLAAVQSMVLQTAGTAASVAEFADILGARVHAMARAHDLLARNGWRGARLRELLADSFESIGRAPAGGGAAGSGAVRIEGDDAFVPARAAQALRMALHELAVNAARHGALSAPGGRVTVTASVRPSPAADRGGRALTLRWVESGGPEVAPPPGRRGFGSKLIERGLAYEAGGGAELEFARDGLRCTITLPLEAAPTPG